MRRRSTRAVICGSPHWNYDRIVEDIIFRLRSAAHSKGKELLIIHGGEPGPESVAQRLCISLGIDQAIYPAQRAMEDLGFKRRNQLMLQEHPIDLVVAFAHVLNESSAVCDMLERANRRGIQIKPIDYKAVAN